MGNGLNYYQDVYVPCIDSNIEKKDWLKIQLKGKTNNFNSIFLAASNETI